VLWFLFDTVLFHDPLLAFHRTDRLAEIAAPGPGLGTYIAHAFGPFGLLVLVVGTIGAWRLRERDVLPGLVLATVPLVLLAEYVAGFPLRERYALLLVPAAAGAVGSLIRFSSPPLRAVAPWLFAAVGIFLALGKDVPDRRLPLTRERAIAAAIDAKVPDCQTIGVTGLGFRSAGLLPPLAVLTGRPLSSFVADPKPGTERVTLAVGDAAKPTPPTTADPSLPPGFEDALVVLISGSGTAFARGDDWVLYGGKPDCS
jgi:hypothetical protein